MKYLCLIYVNKDDIDKADAGKCLAYAASLREEGRVVAAEALRLLPPARTLQIRGSSVTQIDGPFAETKEHLAGVYVVNVTDLDEAVGIVTGIPLEAEHRIEIRPILEIDARS